jgi:transcriptional regulator with XRE-family HTH domain
MRRKPWSHVDDPHAAGRRLRAAREAAGLSQRQLAFPGCTAAYISRVESGDRTPSLQLLRELGKRLGVSADWLATGLELDPAADPLLEAELALRLEDFDEAERIFVAAREVDDPSVRLRALGGLGRLALRRGDTSGAVRQLEEARAGLGDAVLAHPGVLEALGQAYAISGENEAAVGVFEDALRRAGDDRLAAARFSLLLANALVGAGRLPRAAELIDGVRGTVSELSEPEAAARLSWSQSRLHSGRGEHDIAAHYTRRALGALEAAEDAQLPARMHQLRASIELERGNAADALALLDSALPLVTRTGDQFAQALLRLEQARALLALGRSDEAHQVALEVSDLLAGTSGAVAVRPYITLADVFAATGDRPRALDLFEIAAGALGDQPGPLRAGVLARWAELLEADGRTAEALEVLKRVVGPGGSGQTPQGSLSRE